MAEVQDPFSILDLSPDATEDEIKKACLALARNYHPDRLADAPDDVLAHANRLMREVTNAYAQLKGGRLVWWDTSSWSNEDCGNLTSRFCKAEIPHRWDENGFLFADRTWEARIDRIVGP